MRTFLQRWPEVCFVNEDFLTKTTWGVFVNEDFLTKTTWGNYVLSMRTFLHRRREVCFCQWGLSYKDDVRTVLSLRPFLHRRREVCFLSMRTFLQRRREVCLSMRTFTKTMWGRFSVNEDFLTKTSWGRFCQWGLSYKDDVRYVLSMRDFLTKTTWGRFCQWGLSYKDDVRSVYLVGRPGGTLIKKKTEFSLIYKEIQKGAVAKSYMTKYLRIHHIFRGSSSHIWLCNRSHLNFLIYEDNFILFLSVYPYPFPTWINYVQTFITTEITVLVLFPSTFKKFCSFKKT
jgi:hypothetical protein